MGQPTINPEKGEEKKLLLLEMKDEDVFVRVNVDNDEKRKL